MNSMKERYNELECEVVEFESSDVIITSGGEVVPGTGEVGPVNPWA